MALTDEEVLDILKTESSQAIGAHDGILADQIEKLNDYYHGKPYGNEVEGKSQYVTREVYETVESIMPYLIKVFFSSDQAVIFLPEDEEDIAAARQETEYVNYVFYKENKGFKVGYQWLKDGLMNKVGYVHVSREMPEPVTTFYTGKTEEEAALLAESIPADFEGDITASQNDDGTFDITVVEITGRERTVVANVPPEEFRISEGDVEPDSARYVAWHSPRTISDIRAMGLEIDDDIEDNGDELETSTVKLDRHDEISVVDSDSMLDGPNREVILKMEYVRIDKNEDGIAERILFYRVGDTILHEEPVSSQGFCHWSPIIVPHRHHGSTPIDPVMDIQLLKSKVTRNLLDNQERINNGRFAVVDGQVNLDDLMSSAALGIVRENFSGAVRELNTPALDRSAFDIFALADSWAEKQTGVSERGQGLDPRMFNSNTAASTAELVMTNAEQKIELIARIFAETGLKDCMLKIHELGLKHENPDKKIMTNNGEFVAINPDEWRTRYDMMVTVGIGNGSKNQQIFQMQMIEQTMQSIVGAGGLGTIITPQNVWEFAMEKTRVAGRKDGAKFFSRPESNDIDQGPSVEEQVKLMGVQLKEREMALKEGELALDQRRQELEEERLLFDREKHSDEVELKLAEFKAELQEKRSIKLGS